MNKSINHLILVMLLVAAGTSGQRCASAAEADPSGVDVLIAYYTVSGTTQRLAQLVAAGVAEAGGVNVIVKPIADVTLDDLQQAEGIILGSPTHYANMAAPMKTFIDSWFFEFGNPFFGSKVGGAFATGGGSAGGKEHVIVSLLLAMVNSGMVVAGPAYGDGQNGFAMPGAGATNPGPGVDFTENEAEDARRLGLRIAEIARQLAN